MPRPASAPDQWADAGARRPEATGLDGLAGTAAGTTDLVAEFARLARLRDAGVLTREEFQAAQADLIG